MGERVGLRLRDGGHILLQIHGGNGEAMDIEALRVGDGRYFKSGVTDPMPLAEGGSRNRAGIRLPNGGGHVLLRLAEDTADGFQAEALRVDTGEHYKSPSTATQSNVNTERVGLRLRDGGHILLQIHGGNGEAMDIEALRVGDGRY